MALQLICIKWWQLTCCFAIKLNDYTFSVSAAFVSSSFDVNEGEEIQICVELSASQGQLVVEFSMDVAVENGKHLYSGI